jgi:hypothetical protein
MKTSHGTVTFKYLGISKDAELSSHLQFFFPCRNFSSLEMGAEWAINKLTDDPNRVKPFLTEWWPTFGTALFGFSAVCFMNYGTRRPIFAGLFS